MSKIEVDSITQQSGTTVTVGGGACKTAVVDATTVTLGRSGGTVQLASGASQSGFGRTGTVDWQTTPKTGNFTAANGEGYFVNTTSGAVTMTMPSGSAGAIVSIQDYNKTFDTNSLTISPASGEKINGGTADGDLIISTEGQGLTFVYVDSTVGWKTVHENEFTASGSGFMVATGGTITTCGNDKIHTFTGPGTFTVCQTSTTAAENLVSYMVIAGGGGGGNSDGGGGGGAGGFREVKSPTTPYTASPLDGYPSSPNRVTVTATAFPITVGGGGAGGPTATYRGITGSNSIFSTITSAGGGGGGGYGGGPPAPSPQANSAPGANGGSGGGAGAKCSGSAPSIGPYNISGGSGNTPPTTPAQGTNGANARPSYYYAASGGGGASAAGTQGTGGAAAPNSQGGAGGAGVATSITGSSVTRAGGGGGAGWAPGAGGNGGGGTGKHVCNPAYSTAGTDNFGGGGGGGRAAASPTAGSNGGSGVVVIRYKYQ